MLGSGGSKPIKEFRHASSNPNSVYVFDASAFISSLQLYLYEGEIVTPPSVVREVKDFESVARLEIALAVERFKVVEPSRGYVEKAKRIAKSMDLLDRLSQADIEVLALALEYRDKGIEPTVFTDDYDIQRVLRSLGIEFRSVKSRGIG